MLDVATSLTMVVAETSGSTTTSYLRGLGLVAQSDGTTTKYVLTDGLGSVRQVVSHLEKCISWGRQIGDEFQSEERLRQICDDSRSIMTFVMSADDNQH